ncbi:MAG: hypothetical protein ACO4CP_12125 [Steroidobacteraceae bacterium]
MERQALRPVLLTSIPPRREELIPLRGAACSRITLAIESWKAGGFDPVSVNHFSEIEHHSWLPEALSGLGVGLIACGSSTRTDMGPCPFVDFLRAVRLRIGDAPFILVNADIVFPPASRPLAAIVGGLRSGEHMLARRTDVSAGPAGAEQRAVYANGIDLVAACGSAIDSVAPLLDPELSFGRPWWDHYLPLALLAIGSRGRLVDPAWCLHGKHPNRWNGRQYVSIGRVALSRFEQGLVSLPGSAAGREWVTSIDASLSPWPLPAAFGRRARRLALHPALPGPFAASALKRVAAANMRLILRAAAPEPDSRRPVAPQA